MQTDQLKRRDFITLLGGAALAWPLAARAQQSSRMRRVGVLMGLTESDPEAQSRIAAFRKTLQGLGWTEGRNVQVDYYWAAGDIDRTHTLAKELVNSAPDVIVVNTPPGLSALRVETHTIPIVFVQVLDASESTVVLNPARPELVGKRDEALEQLFASAEVLKVIRSPPGELAPVFQALLENAVRIFGAKFGNLLLYEEGAFRVAAMHDAPSVLEELWRRERDPSWPG